MSKVVAKLFNRNTHQDSCASKSLYLSKFSPLEARQQKKETMDKEQTKLSKNFTLEELCATSHKEFQKKNLEYGKSIKVRLENLAGFLEKVRELCGCPLLITSGVRCPELNKAVGGVPTSQHQSGHAADFIPQGKESIEDTFCKIYKSHLIYDELILECVGKKTWIHVSYKGMNGRREALYYNGKKYVPYKG